VLSRILTAPLTLLQMEDLKDAANVQTASIYQPTQIVLLNKEDAFTEETNVWAVMLLLSMI